MALVTEQVTIGDAVFTHVYSDDNHYVLQTDTNIKYVDAYDPVDNPLNHSYVEDEEEIPDPDVDPEANAYELAGRILLGVGDDE
jgi:hypothetical protein